MAKFRKKADVIEAVEWDETVRTRLDLEKLGMEPSGWSGNLNNPDLCENLRIKVFGGVLHVSLGDFIIRQPNGTFLRLDPATFAADYEPVPDAREEE